MFFTEFEERYAEAFLVNAVADTPGSGEKERLTVLVIDIVTAADAEVYMFQVNNADRSIAALGNCPYYQRIASREIVIAPEKVVS